MVVVHVVYNGRGVSGAYVHISWRSGGHSSGRTDSNGYIRFDVSVGEGTLSVDGNEVIRNSPMSGVIEVSPRY